MYIYTYCIYLYNMSSMFCGKWYWSSQNKIWMKIHAWLGSEYNSFGCSTKEEICSRLWLQVIFGVRVLKKTYLFILIYFHHLLFLCLIEDNCTFCQASVMLSFGMFSISMPCFHWKCKVLEVQPSKVYFTGTKILTHLRNF